MTATIDCRSWAEFCSIHIKGAVSIPAEHLFARLHELPQKTEPLVLYGSQAELQLAEAFLTERGYDIIEKLEWNEQLLKRLTDLQQLEQGSLQPRLWQPAPLLQRFVEEFMPHYAIQAGKGLDLACGAGRDLVYLALNGWQMTGVDWSADSIQRVTQLAAQHQVQIKAYQRDLETSSDPLSDWPDEQFDLICVARYLHRPLFPVIRRLLKPNGILIYQTFMKGCENTAVGRPRNPRFLLEPQELASYFPHDDIWLDEIEILPDDRPISAFVVRLRSHLVAC